MIKEPFRVLLFCFFKHSVVAAHIAVLFDVEASF